MPTIKELRKRFKRPSKEAVAEPIESTPEAVPALSPAQEAEESLRVSYGKPMPTGLIGERVVPKPNTFPEWIVERLTAHPAGALLFRPEMRMRGEARVVVPPTGQRGFWRDDLYALLDARAEVDGDRRKWNVVALQGPLEGVVIIWLEWKASDGEGRTPLAEGAYKRCKPPLSRMRFIKGPVLLMRKADWDETR